MKAIIEKLADDTYRLTVYSGEYVQDVIELDSLEKICNYLKWTVGEK